MFIGKWPIDGRLPPQPGEGGNPDSAARQRRRLRARQTVRLSDAGGADAPPRERKRTPRSGKNNGSPVPAVSHRPVNALGAHPLAGEARRMERRQRRGDGLSEPPSTDRIGFKNVTL